MNTKKFTLLVVVALVLACIPMVAGASILVSPSYSQIYVDSTTVKGRNLGADTMTIAITFPDKVTNSAVVAGGAAWTIPVSGTLKVGDVVHLTFDNGVNAPGSRDIIVIEGNGLSNPNKKSTPTTDTAVATDTATPSSTNNTAAPVSGVPVTGDARPMFYFAGGLFVVGLALALLTRALWLRRQDS